MFRSVDPYRGDNVAGSTKIYFVPVSSADKASFPDRIPGTMELDGDITLIPDTTWFYIKCIPNTIDGDSDGKTSAAGTSFDQVVSGFVKSDNPAIATLFKSMTYCRFLALRKDANGHMCLLGTLKEPLRFYFTKRTGSRASNLKGFDFTFRSSSTKSELYYTGSIAPVSTAGYVYSGDNRGGNTELYYVPVDYVEKAVFPSPAPGTLNLNGNIILKAPYQWLHISCNRESIDAETPSFYDAGGSAFDHKASGFVRADTKEVAALFQGMTSTRYIAIRKDANGHMCPMGTLKEPLSFRFTKRPGSAPGQLKGTEFTFYGKCTNPELYYNGTLIQSDGGGYVVQGYVERGYVL